jgi:hypothetical protein
MLRKIRYETKTPLEYQVLLQTGLIRDVTRQHLAPFLNVEPPEIIMTRISSPFMVRTRRRTSSIKTSTSSTYKF